MGTTVDDLDEAWDRGYDELELLKRASSAGLGHLPGRRLPAPRPASWIAARTGDDARAVHRPAGRPPDHARRGRRGRLRSTPSGGPPLHDEHLALGARMDRFGGWWRPWHYGDAVAEYWAVREGVSIGDVSTLGKLVVAGPDVVEVLERIYPCHVADIKPGRSRYALLLNERGHVMDDGMILRESETRFVLTFTSGGAANAEMWLRDWIDDVGPPRPRPGPDDVARRDQRHGAARRGAAAARSAWPSRRASSATSAPTSPACPCHVMRLSFTGEAAFELHHPVDRSVELWRALMDARRATSGSGRTASRRCSGSGSRRATSSSGWTPSSTRRRAGSGWTGRPGWRSRASSAGRRWSGRRSSPDERRWVGFTMDGAGARRGHADLSIADGEVIGNVTGSWTSPLLGQALMLGWQRRRAVRRRRVEIDGREAVVTPTPFYDPEGHRARA